MSSSKWLRLEEAEELDTSEEPLFRREPFIERMDLESASRSLGTEGWWRRARASGTSCPSPWSLVMPWGQGAAGESSPSSQEPRRPPGVGSKLFLPSDLGRCPKLSKLRPYSWIPAEAAFPCPILCPTLG